jgi:hypothetical protein
MAGITKDRLRKAEAKVARESNENYFNCLFATEVEGEYVDKDGKPATPSNSRNRCNVFFAKEGREWLDMSLEAEDRRRSARTERELQRVREAHEQEALYEHELEQQVTEQMCELENHYTTHEQQQEVHLSRDTLPPDQEPLTGYDYLLKTMSKRASRFP